MNGETKTYIMANNQSAKCLFTLLQVHVYILLEIVTVPKPSESVSTVYIISFTAGDDYVPIRNIPIQDVGRRCLDIFILSDRIMEQEETFVVNIVPFDDFLEDPLPVLAQALVTIIEPREFNLLNCVLCYTQNW